MDCNNIDVEIKTISVEPYVKLENSLELESWDKDCEVAYNQQLRHKQKLEFYRNAFDFLYTHKLAGDYYEFGCHKARTFRMALTEARKKNFTDMNFFAFDSFEGLPDVKNNFEHSSVYGHGVLSTAESSFLDIIKTHGLFVEKVQTIKGFYQDSLNGTLKSTLQNNGSKIALAALDCSLYDSFVSSFNFIEDLLQDGSIIYIDDYRVTFNGSPLRGAPKAFKEFSEKSKFKYEPFLDIGWFGKSFIVYSA